MKTDRPTDCIIVIPMKKHPKSIGRLARPQTLLSQTERVLREAIQRGEFEGNRIPAAAELAEEIGVSRETVRLALGAQKPEDLLVKIQHERSSHQPTTIGAPS